ncbi:fructose 1,6-bisphosphatase [Weissella paramesenteroides]|uniref:inositol monophosphatase family protein n=1 Tax=Weissella paramesenteroides TaxID=1249 RepID=UPI0011274E76|nr:inositol monophosphatase family protein [Weissella paramesenteroides]TPF01218.1 fructose 1,6-bisphosphatase [Weissella paramesenteroides]
MDQTQLQKMDETVLDWLDDISHLVMKRVQQRMQIETKSSHRDLVTNFDREVEQYYVQHIRTFDPEAQILGEEGFGDAVKSTEGRIWYVDPIDGTMNFVKQQDEFATMVAVYEDGEPVMAWIMDITKHDVVHGGPDFGVFHNDEPLHAPTDTALKDGLIILSGARLLYEEKGFTELAKSALGYRVYGSAGISYLHVLTGKAVAYLSRMRPWDFAAGIALAKSLGLKVGTIDEHPLNMLVSGSVLVATEKTFDDIKLIQKEWT